MTRKLVIDRSIWLRGELAENSFLCRAADGKMCCIGIYLESCGVPKDKLTGQKVPLKIQELIPEEAQWLVGGSSGTDVMTLMRRNDATKVTYDLENGPSLFSPSNFADYREAIIASIFAKHDVEVEFVDGEAKDAGSNT